ncbi:unnamed protein product [Notodromas monacha]|uniref:Uncharacterized protein n=1 Tax=Notodromas monacha TaxID=399045 RepID=A0A7R9GEN0_9CRUS|nr:unnamed protein product [Notodromas monacha]CAG0918442.1 unnamed protein product [Notodromas monacha]
MTKLTKETAFNWMSQAHMNPSMSTMIMTMVTSTTRAECRSKPRNTNVAANTAVTEITSDDVTSSHMVKKHLVFDTASVALVQHVGDIVSNESGHSQSFIVVFRGSHHGVASHSSTVTSSQTRIISTFWGAKSAVVVGGAAADRSQPVNVIVYPGHGRRHDSGSIGNSLCSVNLLSQRVDVAADGGADPVLGLFVQQRITFLHHEIKFHHTNIRLVQADLDGRRHRHAEGEPGGKGDHDHDADNVAKEERSIQLLEDLVEDAFRGAVLLPLLALHAAKHVEAVVFLATQVQREQRHKRHIFRPICPPTHLKQEVKKQREPGIQGKRPDSRHAAQGTQKEADGLGSGRKQHRRANVAQNTAHVVFDTLALLPSCPLVSLHQDEDIVHADSQDEERDHFNDDKRRRNADVGVKADRCRH